MKKTASEYRNKFWKHAQTYKNSIEIEDLYNKWSIANHFSKELNTQVRAMVNSDIENIKVALTFSGTPEELKDFIESKKLDNADSLSPLSSDIENTPLDTVTDLDTSLDNTLDETPVSQNDSIENQNIETESNQEVLPDMINS